MTAYYNEIDPYAAQWLRNLIDAGHIARGDVDERSIVDVRADDLRSYTQCHFFAGVAGWSLALRLAGWPDDRPVWTGSCPCQPFSAAGKGEAFNDERHLWPAWLPLIAECRPATVFGEQVEAAVGWGWLDTVFADLEQEGYAVGAAILPACSVGAPHIRQRLWFVAHADAARSGEQPGARLFDGERETLRHNTDGRSPPMRMADPLRATGERRAGSLPRAEAQERGARQLDGSSADRPADGGEAHILGDTRHNGRAAWNAGRKWQPEASISQIDRGAGTVSFWSDCDWLPCTDGKARPVGPGSFPLGHGIQQRPSKLRAYGNAIVPQVAAEFIRASEP